MTPDLAGQRAQIEAELTALVAADFPELRGVALVAVPFRASGVFFQARPRLAHLARPGPRREYQVQWNPELFRDPPPPDALRAILAHELGHVLDYLAAGGPGLATLALRVALSPGFRARYERATDRVALERGHGPGLRRYREWLYPRLPPAARAERRRVYLTPEEIDAWLATRGG